VFVLRQKLIVDGHFEPRIRPTVAEKPVQASRGSVRLGSRRLSYGFVHQEYRYVVAHRIHTAALTALQALTSVFQHERLLADRANQYVEKVLRDHVRILRQIENRWSRIWMRSLSRLMRM
jgi:hypothetical protein